MIITGSKSGCAGQIPARQKTKKAEQTSNSDSFSALLAASGRPDTEELLGILRDRKQELLKKVRTGETEPKIQTGARAYTQKEWKKFLEAFDGTEDEKQKLLEEQLKLNKNNLCLRGN